VAGNLKVVLFNSVEFAIFLPIVLALYYMMRHEWQNRMLLVASYLFYGWWDWRFLVLLWISTVVDFFVARALDTSEGKRRKYILMISLFANLGLLGFFKYFNFFINSAAVALQSLGLQPHMTTLQIVLPVGISFYTFQEMGYTIDVYRRKIPACRNFPLFALFVTYFPQLVAGPISRAGDLIENLARKRVVNLDMIYSGCVLLLLGFFKKMAIADTVAPEVNKIFSVANSASWAVLLKGIWLFSIQIYCDFSGYSDIARGVSRLLGVDITENFAQPYFSTSVTEFWRRWHISLSTWLRDYLYIPLGGSWGGTVKTYRNLMLTMLLGGLWHGASWTFVVWGALHGMYLSVHKWMLGDKKVRIDDKEPKRWNVINVFKLLATLQLIMLAWIFFRAPSFGAARDYIAGILMLRGGLGAFHLPDVAYVAFFAILVVFVDLPQYRKSGDHTAILTWSWPARGVAMAAMLLLLLIMGENNDIPFIYFQF